MIEVRPVLDAEIAAALNALPLDPPATLESIPALRTASRAMEDRVDLCGSVERRDHVVPSDPDAIVGVHRPRRGDRVSRAGIYWVHGGGYILGSYRECDRQLQRWCRLLDCVAVSVEYRLAPEHPYPAALEDCYAGLKWTYEHAAELGLDAARLGVGGTSAGAGLAAALALIARDRGEIPLAFQLLVAPMLDDRKLTVSSRWDAPIWPPASNELGWRSYLGELRGHVVPPYAAAARAEHLSGLPPTLVVVGGVDGFLDESIAYAQRLLHAGISTQLNVYSGAPHGFLELAPASRLANLANRDIEDWLGPFCGESSQAPVSDRR
ncbi:MAG: alpha/beta hydrolase [Gaiellaceae bacterium MAG52_C11]|nr:alpha/beta hydrolase [Candidatus Gaiellasilicea maunaloa]